jgi:hypothetical protein
MGMSTAIDQDISALAAQMGVSYADLACFANSTAIGLVNDKINADAIPEDMRTDVALAYAQHAVRKFERFRAAYHEPIARKTFIRSVCALAKGQP